MSKRTIVILLIISLLSSVALVANHEKQRSSYANAVLGSVLKNLQITA